MLQLPTQSTQVPLNSRPVDNPGCRASTCAVLHTRQKLFRACLAVTVAVRNLDDRQLLPLIGAGYMIVNELGLNPCRLWSEAAFPPRLPT